MKKKLTPTEEDELVASLDALERQGSVVSTRDARGEKLYSLTPKGMEETEKYAMQFPGRTLIDDLNTANASIRRTIESSERAAGIDLGPATDVQLYDLAGMGRRRRIETPDGPIGVARAVLDQLVTAGIVTDDHGTYSAASRAVIDAALGAGKITGVCDFCSEPGPSEVFPTDDFQIDEVDWKSTGGWAACETCALLVRDDKREALFERSVILRPGDLDNGPEVTRAAIKALLDRFWQAYRPLVTLPAAFKSRSFASMLASVLPRAPGIGIELAKLADERSTDLDIGPGVEVIQRLERDGVIRFAIRRGDGNPALFAAPAKHFASTADADIAHRLVGYFHHGGTFDANDGTIVEEGEQHVTVDEWLRTSGRKGLKDIAREAKMSHGHVAAILRNLDERGHIEAVRAGEGGRYEGIIVRVRANLNDLARNEKIVVAAVAHVFGIVDNGKVDARTIGQPSDEHHVSQSPWMEAIEMQFAALKEITRLISNPKTATVLDGAELIASWRLNAKQLHRAETYAWGRDTTLAVQAASRSFPHDAGIRPEQVPGSGQGWFWFSDPLPIPTNSEATNVCGLLWGWCYPGDGTGPVHEKTAVADTEWLLFTAFYRDKRGRIVGSVQWRWFQGETFHNMIARCMAEYDEYDGDGHLGLGTGSVGKARRALLEAAGTTPYPKDKTIKAIGDLSLFFLAACVWLESDVIALSTGHVERHRAKSLEREHRLRTRPAEIKVVALRRVKYEHGGAAADGNGGGSGKREYTCQWVVDGHPRNQYYASIKQHKCIWIKPYPKGPKDKPMRVASHKVFAVVR